MLVKAASLYLPHTDGVRWKVFIVESARGDPCGDDQSSSTQPPQLLFTVQWVFNYFYKGMRLAYPSVFARASGQSVSMLLTHPLKMCLSCLDGWLCKHLALIDA